MSDDKRNKSTDSLEALRSLALSRVRDEYENIASMSRLGIDRLNRHLPPTRRYRSLRELLDRYWGRANDVASFAVGLGLITPEQNLEIIREFQAAHPELAGNESSGPFGNV